MREYWRQHLRDWRLERDLSQTQLALLAKVSQPTISFLETGRKRKGKKDCGFTQAMLDPILKVLKKDYAALFCPYHFSCKEVVKDILSKSRKGDKKPDSKKHRKIPSRLLKIVK